MLLITVKKYQVINKSFHFTQSPLADRRIFITKFSPASSDLC